ncbi:hypothetical protein [Candidatus Nitrososphaera sp. FF02]|uniref:hypothetical protein n=1 Tax=Candidatus Nitrososphaera sp. FF02 TaxID=3398226 RepID=UPI0039E987E4
MSAATGVMAAQSRETKWRFLICRSCYWCASCTPERFVPHCPVCHSRAIERMAV